MKIAIKNLIPNEEWQTRNQLDEANVKRLMEAVQSGLP